MRRLPWSSLTMKAPAHNRAKADSAPRKGSTIVVVIALLLALTFLGIVAYTVGTQEYGNAVYFSDASQEDAFGISRDTLFDWSLRQIILGTDQDKERQSALHGGHMSLLGTMYGYNSTPYDGEGVHLRFNGTDIEVDQDYNPATADFGDLLEINRAPFAQTSGKIPNQAVGTGYPAPDVGYNYWDINSPYLAYVNPKHVSDTLGNTLGVILPSYHRPQYLRTQIIDPVSGTYQSVPADQWYSSPLTERRVLRPHQEHPAVAPNGQVTNIRRFVSAAHPEAGMTSFPFAANTGAQTNTDTDPTNDGVWDGVWNGGPANQANVSYDADPDNDGYREAIWLDLGYPMQIRENPDGTVTKFVPMFAVTLYDADALFNLNAHGNLAGASFLNNSANPFGSYGPGPDGLYGTTDDDLRFVSRSNQGFAVSEVNPEWGLDASTADGSTTQHQRFFGQAPANSTELANMEWWFLLKGRADLDSSGNVDKLYPGRYGEITQLDTAITGNLPVFGYPSAGDTFTANPTSFNIATNSAMDDNRDALLGGRYDGDGTYFPSNPSNPTFFPAWRQPLDLTGNGRFTKPLPTTPVKNPGYGRQRNLLNYSGRRQQWPAYRGYQHNDQIGLYANPDTQFLLPSNSLRYNVDEPEEMILEPEYLRSDLDAPFGAGENATLHLAQADQDVLGLAGRLRDLAQVNFDGSNAVLTEERRRRFTTTSWDLKSLGLTEYISTTPPASAREWEYTTTGSFPPGNLLTITPSVFRCPDPNVPNLSTNVSNSPIVELFRTNSGSLNNFSIRKLSINHLCEWAGTPGASNLIFRPLTPHPDGNGPYGKLGATPVINPGLANPSQIASATAQEWFARRDRQQLCRDIYTLMYLFCGGKDQDYTQTGAYPIDFDADGDGTQETNFQLHQMAQFAVNLVDRMDPDKVVTKFEYDLDLSDGWDLNDDPFDDLAGSATNGEPDRAIVYGVESQQLAINEAQFIFAKLVEDLNVAQDHEATAWDDSTNHDWSYIELENVGTEYVDFQNEAWEIVVKPLGTLMVPDPTDPMLPQITVTPEERRLVFTSNLTSRIYSAADPVNGANTTFAIGAAGYNDVPTSEFRVNRNHKTGITGQPANPDNDTQPLINMVPYPKIAPRGLLDLNLLSGSGTEFRVVQPNPYTHLPYADGQAVSADAANPMAHFVGEKLLELGPTVPRNSEVLTDAQDRALKIQVQLRRRLNPYRDGVTPRVGQTATPETHDWESIDNPWIVVDTITVPLHVFHLEKNDAFVQVRNQLRDMKNENPERVEPLLATTPTTQFQNPTPEPNPGSFQNNSIGLANLTANNPYNRYQPHFDRDYASAMELMAVPLYGPLETTQKLNQSDMAFTLGKAVVAADKFLHPEPVLSGTPETGNRWYRLFEFVEVPDRSHRHPAYDASGNLRPSYIINLGNRLDPNNRDPIYRRPGRIQLNTLRHPEVLAGLLDDPEVALLGSGTQHLPDQAVGTGSGNARDWWTQFVQARDGIDPVLQGPPYNMNVFLPGLPSSKPFRPFSYSAEGDASLQSTLLRDLPRDPVDRTGSPPTYPRSLFELGDEPGSGNPVDHSVKYRMLEKVNNNSTTRSNVFLIFVQVDFFEAAEVPAGGGQTVVRVGGKLSDSPAYRGFFVVDRSKSKYLLGSGDFPKQFPDQADGNTVKFNYSFNQDFDYHQLILHRQTIN